MFFDWFGVEVDQGNLLSLLVVSGGGNAWQTLEAIPIFLMLAIAVAVGAALMGIVGSNWKPVVPPSAAVTVLGGLAVLLILIRIVFPPGFSGSVGNGKSIEPTLKVGVFFALAAALGIAFGGFLAMREEGRLGRPRPFPSEPG
jgi:hypothetical protein